jgi:hypothetical protein
MKYSRYINNLRDYLYGWLWHIKGDWSMPSNFSLCSWASTTDLIRLGMDSGILDILLKMPDLENSTLKG